MNVAFCRECGRYVALTGEGACPSGHGRPSLHDVGERSSAEAERLLAVGRHPRIPSGQSSRPAASAPGDFDRVSPLFAPLADRRLNRFQYAVLTLWLMPILLAVPVTLADGQTAAPLLPVGITALQMLALALAYTLVVSFAYDTTDLAVFDARRQVPGLMLLPLQGLTAVAHAVPLPVPPLAGRVGIMASWFVAWVMLALAALPRRPDLAPSVLDSHLGGVADFVLDPGPGGDGWVDMTDVLDDRSNG